MKEIEACGVSMTTLWLASIVTTCMMKGINGTIGEMWKMEWCLDCQRVWTIFTCTQRATMSLAMSVK